MDVSAYRVATREELWLDHRLVERRLSHGEAILSENRLLATDTLDETLVAAADAAMERLREISRNVVADSARVRLLAEARPDGIFSTLVIREGRFSVVTTPEEVETHYELLRATASIEPEGHITGYRRMPIVWRNGSAAVLLHEAAGHPAEHSHAPLPWPSWLRVTDGDADLLAGDMPPLWRRASFRDVPLRRMHQLRVQQISAPFELPERRIEVLLVDGGGYEPLGEIVTLRVAAADLVEPEGTRRLEPFEIMETRAAVTRSLAGATGDPISYPGVVCSREGQELVVSSAAPVMVTVF